MNISPHGSDAHRQHCSLTHAGEHPKSVESMLSQLGVYLRTAVYGLDTRPLLKEAASKVFGSAAGMVDMLVKHIPSARRATATKVNTDYTGGVDFKLRPISYRFRVLYSVD